MWWELPRHCLQLMYLWLLHFTYPWVFWAVYDLGQGATGPWSGWTGQATICHMHQPGTNYVPVEEVFFKTWEGGHWWKSSGALTVAFIDTFIIWNLSYGRPRESSFFSQHATLGRRKEAFLADLTRGWALFHMFLIRDARESRYSMATLLSFSAMR